MANNIQIETTQTTTNAQPAVRNRSGAFPQVTHPAAFSPSTIIDPSVHEEFALRYTAAASARRYDPTPSKSAYTANDPSPALVKTAVGITLSIIVAIASMFVLSSHTQSVLPTTTIPQSAISTR